MNCKKCNCKDVEFRQAGPHIGAYCKNCGAFVKFASKKEVEEYARQTSMTNFEWLKTLTLEEFARNIFYRDCAQGRRFDNFVEWLKELHTKETEL